MNVGTSMKRKEDPRMITGRGRYTEDINLPGMLHATIVRSPEAHADIVSIDTSAAKEHPGVVAVLSGEEMAATSLAGLHRSGTRPASRSASPTTGRSSAARSSTSATRWPWSWRPAAAWPPTPPRT